MKQKLQNRKGRTLESLLPQKWLLSLLTLMLFCIGTGHTWADTQVWSVDFNQLVESEGIADKTQLSNSSNENYKKMGLNINISQLNLAGVPTNVYLQNIGDFRWLKKDGVFYLNQIGSGQRYLVIKNCKAGQKLSITHNGVDSNSDTPIYDEVGNLENKNEVENTYTYDVVATGDVYLKLGRRALIKGFALYAPSTCTNTDHAVWSGSTVGTGSDAFNTSFSQFYELESGKQYHFTFHIAGGDATYKNWYLQAAKSKVHNGDAGWDGQELLWVRADKFGAADFHLYKGNMNTELNASTENVSTFDAATDADLKNADVDMTVSCADNRLFVFATTTGASGTKYYLTGVKDADNGGNPIQLFFGVESAKITSLAAEKKTVYKNRVHLESGKGSGYITIDEISAPFYEKDGDKISYFTEGLNIKIYAEPASGYKFNKIGLSNDNPRSFTTRKPAVEDVFNLGFDFDGIRYELNGGEGKTEDSKDNVILPRPTKAGYTFVGWMNESTDIVPNAGKAGETKSFAGGTTLYALWYKNNCVIDFTNAGPLNGTSDNAGANISETGMFIAGGTPVGNITVGGKAIDSRFGVQTGTTWRYHNNGLYSANSGNRSYGIKGCVEGDYITVVSSVNPNVNDADAELISQDGETYLYRVKQDGNVKFSPARYSVLRSITIAGPCPHTVWTNGNVGDADHMAGWWNNFSQNYKIEKGQTLNFKFTIHGGNYSADNWCFYAQAIEKHNGDLGVTNPDAERVILRADGLRGASTGYGPISFTRNGIELSRGTWEASIDDAQFVNDMKNAVVNMTVTFGTDGIMNVVATTVVGSNTYRLSETSTTISENTLYCFLEAANSWIEGITHPITFETPNPVGYLTSNGTLTYSQKAIGNPEGTWVKYEIVSYEGVENPSISQIDGSSDYTLNVKGKGTVTVKASCGDNTAEYTLTVQGLMFTNSSPYVVHGTTSYDMTLSDGDVAGVDFQLVKYDTTPCFRNVTLTKVGNTCKVTGISNAEDAGGIIVVRAKTTDSEGKVVFTDCCLTVAYDLHVWDMYSDPLNYGSLVEGNAEDVVTGNPDAMNPESRVGSAHYIVYNESNKYKYVLQGDDEEGTQDEAKENENRVEYNNWLDGQDYYFKENWYNAQSGTQICNAEGGKKNYNLLHNYWKFTYKTCSYENGVRTYVNEPLFAYKNTVIGDNGRVIKETAGLRFNAPSGKFGVSDNDTQDSEGGSRSVREQDRCVLLQVGSRLCIPRVKEGRFIRIHWYRHSDNSGDRCKITNGMDLDGRMINPDDVIRFTGSHYYGTGDGHKGSFVFKVKKSDSALPQNYETIGGETYCDVFIDPYGIGWTEFYRIEIMDKFDSELQLSEVDASNLITADQIKGKRTTADIGQPQVTIDNFNSRDINDQANYNRTIYGKCNDGETINNNPVYASRLTSKIRTRAKAEQENDLANLNVPVNAEDYAPMLYISGYPGHSYTWNGWLNTTLQADFMGTSARCDIETKSNAGWTQENTIPAEPIWVGNNLKYTMHPLKNVYGEGLIKLTLRTHSGWDNEPHYTFDKREAIVAVGQYSVQDYPYTWDFTNYNFDKDNKYGGKTYSSMSDTNVNVEKQYGNWKPKDDAWEMATYQNSITSKYTTGSSYIEVADSKKVNLPKFAQGSQLSLGVNGEKHTILETEGLRINVDKINTENNSKVVLKKADKGGNLTVNGTITIPEVDEGMYVFVRLPENAPAPTAKLVYKELNSTTGAYDTKEVELNQTRTNKEHVSFYADDVDVEMNTGDIPSNVYVYKQDKEGKNDVVIYPNSSIEAIGVTNYFKPMVHFDNTARSRFATDSREERIDYSNTKLFTNHQLIANIAKNPTTSYKEGDEEMYKENGNIDLCPVTVVPGIEDAPGMNRGLVVETNPVANCTTTTTRPLLPLFVPACNIPDGSIEGNLLIERIKGGNEEPLPASTKNGTFNYILTNQYYDWHWAEGTWNKDKDKDGNEVDHSHNMAEAVAFYILREDSPARKNSAYLSIPCPSGPSSVKQFYMLLGGNGEESVTAIENISIPTGIEESVEPIAVYTITGVKVNGMPTKKGIYVVNGKKVFVK